MPKLCEYENCRERASYGVKRTNPIRCKTHKENMKLCSRICKCGKSRPNFNEPGEKSPICCASCKTNTMIDVNSKKCKCGKSQPIYNNPDEKSPICCASCKTETMVNVVTKKCKCGKYQPAFNEPGESKAICCASCKTETMVNVVTKKCKCGIIAIYNEPGESRGICCSSCKTETMIDVRHSKCKCGKYQPTFNEPGESKAICCKSCKTDTMIDVRHSKCKCGKYQPAFNEPGERIPIYCSLCKSNTMVDVCHKRCKGQNGLCNILGNRKYKGYCTFCFSREFPLDPLSFQIRSKTKEIAVRDFINANFNGFQHDKPLYTSHCDCSIKRRLDHYQLLNNTMLCVETDENQHKSYDKMDEEMRYDDLYNAFSGKWIYIRFNPDKYKNKKGVSKNPDISKRLFTLKDEIEKQIKRIENEENKDLVERIYLYYDDYN
jgi:hypothetical protein